MKKIISYIIAFSVVFSFAALNRVCAEELMISKSGTSIIEAENASFKYAGSRESDMASGGKYIVFDTSIAAANQTVVVNAEETGYYTLDMIVGAAGANDAYSSVSVQINEETEKTLKGSDIDSGKSSFNGYAGLPLKYFRVYDKVYLVEGENVINITMSARPGFASNVLAQFDAFVFAPYEEQSTPTPTPTPPPEVPIIGGSNYVIEAESQISDYTIIDNEFASGGKVVMFNKASSDAAVFDIAFDVEEEGQYVVSFLAANTLTNVWISDMSFGIGGEMIEMSAANFIVLSPEESYVDKNYPIKILRYNKKVAFEKGRNAITVKVKLRSYGDLAAALDCIQIQKEKDITKGVSVEDLVISEGEIADLTLKNAAGERLYEYDTDDISIEMSEYGIAGADGLKIEGYNRGKTEFTVTVKKDDEIKTAKGNIIVVSDAGLYLSDVRKSSDKITAKVNAVSDYGGGDYILIAVYGFDGKVKSSLKQIIVQQIPSVSEGEAVEFTAQANSAENGDSMAVYITDGTYTESLYGKTEIK